MRALFVLFLLLLPVFAQESPEMRSTALALEKEGNFQEAFELRKKLLTIQDDPHSGRDLLLAHKSLYQLGRESEIDSLIAALLSKRKDNAYLLEAAADLFAGELNPWGTVQDGNFLRSRDSSGDYIGVEEQDRLQALQLYKKALDLFEEDPKSEVRVLRKLGEVLIEDRRDSQSVWQLYTLTDTKVVPDYTRSLDAITTLGPPVDSNGEPEYFGIPESYELAESDGERWRWTIAESSRIAPEEDAPDRLSWLSFCNDIFGVETLSSYSWFQNRDPENADALLQISTLKEAETFAQLATGPRRFTLPPDFRFIPLLRELMRSGRTSDHGLAGDLIVQIFLDRDQRVAAAEMLRELIETHGDPSNSRSNLLQQISGPWSRFPVTPTQYSGEPISIPYTFRNAAETSLKLHSIDESLILKDIKEYLKSNPKELDHERINFSSLGSKLIGESRKRYLGPEIRVWKEQLNAGEDHEDITTSIDIGKLPPGCYLLESVLEGGNTSWVVLWVRDLVILKHSAASAQSFHLVSAESGHAVPGTLEFFAFQSSIEQEREGERSLKVETQEISAKTDLQGFFQLKKMKAFEFATWHLTATTADGRQTHLTGAPFYWRSDEQDQLRNRRTFGISDRPVYRPGQTVHLKLWAAEASYTRDDQSFYADKNGLLEIRDPRNEVVLEKQSFTTDSYGGAGYEFELPSDAALGNYQVSVSGQLPSASFSFRVEEYKKPEYEVSVEAPSEPVVLGEKIKAKVMANYYHGAPVAEAVVNLKVHREFFTEKYFPSGDWDWLYGPGYGWLSQAYDFYPGWNLWGCIRPSPPWWNQQRRGSPELILEQQTRISSDGTAEFTIDTATAKLIHPDQDHSYTITAEVVDASRRSIVGSGTVLAAREPFTVITWLDSGYGVPGQKLTVRYEARTLDGTVVSGTPNAKLYRSSLDANGDITESLIKTFPVKDNRFSFVAPEPGQYRAELSFTDTKNRTQKGATVFTIYGPADSGNPSSTPANLRYNALELIPDKSSYQPGEAVKLLINTDKADSRVLLFLRSGQGDEAHTESILLDGQSQIIEIPISRKDMPNFFVEGVTVADGQVHTSTIEIAIPPEKRILNVAVTAREAAP